MSGRTDLAGHLTTALPDFTVIDHDAEPTLSKITVMVYTERLESGVTVAFRRYDIVALVMTPKQTSGDLSLEDALEEVLEAIDLWDFPITWREVERVTYADTYPGFKVTCEMHVKREYPTDTATGLLAAEPEPIPEEG